LLRKRGRERLCLKVIPQKRVFGFKEKKKPEGGVRWVLCCSPVGGENENMEGQEKRKVQRQKYVERIKHAGKQEGNGNEFRGTHKSGELHPCGAKVYEKKVCEYW